MGQSIRLILVLASITCSSTLIAQSPPLTITNSPPGGYINIPYNFQFTASGGVKPYSWSWSGQDCGGPGCQTPPGLSMSTGGAVTGTPSQLGTFLVQVFVGDNFNNFNSLAFSISILPCTLSFNTGSTLSSADVGTPYSQAINITAVGCTPPYAFTTRPTDPSSQISLPPGLSISPAAQDSPSAVISGTPTTANTYSFNVTVTEANKANATSPFSITVNPPLAIAATSPLPAATIGQAYSQSLKPSGGTPPYFAITLDNAPPGMTLDSPTGVLHGTPPKGSIGTYTFTATL
ncbi:MAG TPA: Ig domain-containing protein, partial [Bryobacteraceae bacterium]